MSRLLDLTDRVVGRLLVKEPVGRDKYGQVLWRTVCECGKEKIVVSTHLSRNIVRSCGCLSRDTTSKVLTKHGGSKTPEYHVWLGIKSRCQDPKDKGYVNYGARGITVCSEWSGPDGFSAFIRDMGPRPHPKASIDRIDNNKGYSPDNCRWASRREQANNRRGNLRLIHRGIEYTGSEFARTFGFKPSQVHNWARKGLGPEEILEKKCTGNSGMEKS